MKLKDLESTLDCTVLVRGRRYPDGEFSDVVASDMMSDILATDRNDFLILTSLTSEQVVRTADLTGAHAVLLVNGKTPMSTMRRLAEENGLTLLSTPLSCFHACVKLGRRLESEKSA